jgi:hypothetical protein
VNQVTDPFAPHLFTFKRTDVQRQPVNAIRKSPRLVLVYGPYGELPPT